MLEELSEMQKRERLYIHAVIHANCKHEKVTQNSCTGTLIDWENEVVEKLTSCPQCGKILKCEIIPFSKKKPT
jgi:hypothetical protein